MRKYLIVIILLLFNPESYAQLEIAKGDSVNISWESVIWWDANKEIDLKGYNVTITEEKTGFKKVVWVGKETKYFYTQDIMDTTKKYHVFVTALDIVGNKSAPSEIIEFPNPFEQ